MSHPAPLLLSHGDRNTLTKWAHSATAPYRVVAPAKALLMAGDGIANTCIATTLSISRPTLLKWRARFLSDGLDSVGTVRAGRGRKPRITQHQVQAIVHATLHETPPGATHWSCRSMAKAAGVGRSTVQRIWDAQLVAGTPPGPDVLQVFVAQGVVAQQVRLALRKGKQGRPLPAGQDGSPCHSLSLDVCKTQNETWHKIHGGARRRPPAPSCPKRPFATHADRLRPRALWPRDYAARSKKARHRRASGLRRPFSVSTL